MLGWSPRLTDERAAAAEAERVGLKVTDPEVAQRIYTIPAFQENGQFIGEQRYQQLLSMQRPPLTAGAFEDSIRRAIIVEGILIYTHAALRDLMSVKVFVDTDADTRFIRRLRRDVAERGRTMDSVIEQYLSTVKPMHLDFVEPSKRWADIIIPKGGENEVAIDMVVTKINALLRQQAASKTAH